MKNFIVLDVEGYSTCKPYNIGYIVGNKRGEILEKKSYALMPCVWDNLEYKYRTANVEGLKGAHEMAHNNIKEILCVDDKKYNKLFDNNKFFGDFLTDITKYEVKRIWAYNCTFDRGALERLFNEQQSQIVNNLVTFCDIIPAILHTKLLNEDYINWCKENNFLTAKGNVQTKAEVVYRYLTGNLEFVEEHTGLADCMIEYQILLEAMKTSNNVKYAPCQAWKVIQKFCESEGIYIPALDNI